MRFQDLQDVLHGGATLLTSTQRSARLWRDRLIQADPTLRPAVLPWGAWTASMWQAAVLRGDADMVLLNPMQNAELWAQILRQIKPGTLRPLRSLVDLCVQAQHLLHGYCADDAMRHFTGLAGSDSAQFAEWFRAFSEVCDQQRLLPAAALEGALQRLPGRPFNLPLVLVGFDELLPSRRLLLDRVSNDGIPVISMDTASLMEVEDGPATMVVCRDRHDEWAHIGRALREAVAENRSGSIMVVVPDLDASRQALERELRRALASDSATAELDWEFSAGRRLGTLPIAADAIELLRWVLGPASIGSVSALLQSPYLNFGVSLDEAAEIDIQVLRAPEQVRPEWTLQQLAARCKPATRDILYAISSAAHQLKGVRTMGAWTEVAAKVLQAAGWPGQRELSSDEYQTLDRWSDLLDSLASLDIFERPLPFADFVSMLSEGAAALRFAPQNKGAAIQILSPDEAAGVTADWLWFAHANDTSWSGRRSASPLVPWSLQVEFGMPGTDPARDGEAHRRTMERLLRSATHATVSYAETDNTGTVSRAAVLRSFPMIRRPNDAAPDLLPAPMLEVLRDDTGPAFASDLPVPGGVGALQSQAACPFRAFVERRLHASSPEPVELGFDARDRGIHMHGVLERFWNRTRTQAELLRLRGAGELDASVQGDIDAVLPIRQGHAWAAAYLRVQRSRLKQVVLQWLAIEADRPPFQVEETERKVDAAMGSLRFNIRVDRVDAVIEDEEPSLVLIDYKTGKASATGWMGPRPDEPQLPFYAVAAGMGNVQAIAFATLKPGDKNMGLRAFPAATPLLGISKRINQPQNFSEQAEEWKDTLLRLSEEFAAGSAQVDPKDYPGTCKHCRQRVLCRLDPELLEDGDDDTTEDGA